MWIAIVCKFHNIQVFLNGFPDYFSALKTAFSAPSFMKCGISLPPIMEHTQNAMLSQQDKLYIKVPRKIIFLLNILDEHLTELYGCGEQTTLKLPQAIFCSFWSYSLSKRVWPKIVGLLKSLNWLFSRFIASIYPKSKISSDIIYNETRVLLIFFYKLPVCIPTEFW